MINLQTKPNSLDYILQIRDIDERHMQLEICKLNLQKVEEDAETRIRKMRIEVPKKITEYMVMEEQQS